MKKRYYLVTAICEINKIAKDPIKMLKVIGLRDTPKFYKLHYYNLVLNKSLSSIQNSGVASEIVNKKLGDQFKQFTDRQIEGAYAMKDIMEKFIIKNYGEDTLDILKEDLENEFTNQFGDGSLSVGDMNDANDALKEKGYEEISMYEDLTKVKMFP